MPRNSSHEGYGDPWGRFSLAAATAAVLALVAWASVRIGWTSGRDQLVLTKPALHRRRPQVLAIRQPPGRRFSSPASGPSASGVALAMVDCGVALLAEAWMGAERAKGQALTAYAVDLYDSWLEEFGVALASPRDPERRGAHVTLAHSDELVLVQALSDQGVIPDFRHPDGIRIGLAPLTTRFTDVYDGLNALRSLLDALAA